VVASDIPAFRDVAGDCARYVQPGDAGELAKAIVDLIGDPAAARAQGSQARERARAFDWPAATTRYVELYGLALGMSALSDR
jgi:glycosyltransferase involved in cell wall biosynthesis